MSTRINNRTVKFCKITLVLMLFIVGLPVVFANTVERSFSAQTVPPQTEMTVTLTIDVTEALFYSWQETVPVGWTIMRTSRGNIAGRTVADVVFGGVQDTTIEYVVRSPDALGPHIFRGTYMFSGMAEEVPIGGPDTVTVEPAPFPPAELSENDVCGGNIPTPCGQGLICRKENLVSLTLQCLPLSGQGGFCENTAGCTEDLRCQAGHCLPRPAGGLRSPCSVDADCGADNLFCNNDDVCDSSTCTDTDEANDPAVAGVATLNNEVAPDVTKKDECVNPNQTNEWFCLSPEGGLSNRHADCPADTTCRLNAGRVAVCQAVVQCTDSDNGADTSVLGEVRIGDLPPLPDFCDGNDVIEGVCVNDGHDYDDVRVPCPNGCRDGVCLGAPPAELSENEVCGGNIPTPCGQGLICRKENLASLTLQCLPLSGQGGYCENTDGCAAGFTCQAGHCLLPPPEHCTDSDNGNTPSIQGTTHARGGLGAPFIDLTDRCNGNVLNEFVCGANDIISELTYDCSAEGKVCQNGACVLGEVPPGGNLGTFNETCRDAEPLCDSGLVCNANICEEAPPPGPAAVCLDNDGFNTSLAGIVNVGGMDFIDECISDQELLEGTCNADGNDIVDVRVLCPNGCEGGGCRVTPAWSCVDNDDGEVDETLVQASAIPCDLVMGECHTLRDSCVRIGAEGDEDVSSCRGENCKLVELQCENDRLVESKIDIPDGKECSAGAIRDVRGGGRGRRLVRPGSLSCEDPCVPQLLDACRALVESEETRPQLMGCVMDTMIRAGAPVQCNLAPGCLDAIREGRACEALPEAERGACTVEVNTRHAAIAAICGTQITDLTYCLISQGFNAGGLGQACLDDRCLEGFGCDAQEICRKQCADSGVCDIAGGESCTDGLCVVPPPPVGILNTPCRVDEPKCDIGLVCGAANVCEKAPPVCEDDDGFNLGEAGEVRIDNLSFVDTCIDDQNLLEAVCTPENDDVLDVRVACEHGCAEGICLQPVPCTDTDGGKADQIYRIGNVLDANGTILARDTCAPDALTLREGMCVNGTMQVADITCDEMCFANACTRPPAPREEGEEDGGDVRVQEEGGEEERDEAREEGGEERREERRRASRGDDRGRDRTRYAGYAPGGFPGCGDRFCDSRYGENILTCPADCAVPGQQPPVVPPATPPGPSLPQVGVGGPQSRPLSAPTPPPPEQLDYGETGPSLAELQEPQAQPTTEFDVGEVPEFKGVPEPIPGTGVMVYVLLSLASLVVIGGGTAGYFVYARSHAKFEKLKQYVEYYTKQGYTKMAMQQHLQNYGVTPDYLDKLYAAAEQSQAKQTGALGAPVTGSAERSLGDKVGEVWQSFKFKVQDAWESIASKFRKKEI